MGEVCFDDDNDDDDDDDDLIIFILPITLSTNKSPMYSNKHVWNSQQLLLSNILET